jgi:hypothetical protein
MLPETQFFLFIGIPHLLRYTLSKSFRIIIFPKKLHKIHVWIHQVHENGVINKIVIALIFSLHVIYAILMSHLLNGFYTASQSH